MQVVFRKPICYLIKTVHRGSDKLMQQEPKLDRPGAGLPFYEWALVKFIIFPLRMQKTSKASALRDFQQESKDILEAVSALSVEQLGERRLIKRLPGLEDSSRFWSCAMTMDHLIIVGKRMQTVLTALSSGSNELPAASIEAVKPSVQVEASTIIDEFKQMTKDFVEKVERLDLAAHPKVKFKHPWFGDMNAVQWLAFAAPHQHIHRRQIKEIIKRL